MGYTQVYDPLSNIFLSALVAALPIFLFLVSLVVFKLKGWLAALLTVTLSSLIAILFYKMPVSLTLMSFTQGFLTGLWPIAWIILAAIFLYKLSVKSGYFEILKKSIMSITPDHRIQVILVGFCFGAFLEGAIGFGAPVAISAALLMGLGLRPLYAAGLCMIANTAPVAFGAVGIPIIALGKAVGVDPNLISKLSGYMLPPIAIFVPFFIVFLIDGVKGVKETFLPILVAASSFAITQFLTAVYLGPELPDITSALVSISLTTIFLKFYKVKNVFRFDGATDFSNTEKIPTKELVNAWLPFVFLIACIVVWAIPAVKTALTSFNIAFELPMLHKAVIEVAPIKAKDTAIAAIYTWDILKATGTAILLAAVLTIFALKLKTQVVIGAAKETFNEMMIPIITVGLVVAYASIAKNSGQAATMGLAMANTGGAFAFFSPVIGWLGVFLTGSDTSSNLLFGALQQVTANQLGINEVIFLAANTVGGVVGKMISPQSIAIACAAVGLVGRESELFKFTLKYSLIFIILMGICTWSFVNLFPSLIPAI
ncbi:lactate permease LctP family transporter [Campylobacter gastrosuis]|uniref:L-lactate permease n=1 Tax=Campylobacter gastrosuis TaxID=2974576 RepID=A0ABT7HM60_9BACT|nr:lactate permease LctP family transporter [Campylobacter gastrosuis]MDL0087850.1 lactate permease LctP family transporter [Campylobacter gastrosuis]MDL0088061.1 lactate permease LctP family transporter [Campylobacter gastrosuis]